MFARDVQDALNIVMEPQLLQGLRHMFASNGLLGLFFGDVVGFRGDESNELNAAFDEEVARFFGKGLA